MDYKKIIKEIPYNPGVYLMKDKDNKIIYIGKAKSLKKRVRQYFNKTNKTVRIQKMVEQIENIEYIITDNEVEALVLECNYIKQYMPKYNVLLKDDKTYPYIKITINDEYPIIFSTRNKKEDGSIYLGPYTDVSAMNTTLEVVKEIFPLKRCKYNLNKSCNKKIGPCLYYHIGRCMGPCINNVKKTEYKDMINNIILFLEGKTKEVENNIKQRIDEYIQKLEFEKANELKIRLESITNLKNKQKVGNTDLVDTDVWGYVLFQNKLYIQIFKVRKTNVLSHDNMAIEDIEEATINETILSLMAQYYKENSDIPNDIYVKLNKDDQIEEDLKVLQEYISKFVSYKVKIKTPKKGNKFAYIKMAESNIKMKLEDKNVDMMEKLKDILNLDQDINIIEAYDISNLRNAYIVGTYITYENGKFNKKKYRKFKIKSTETQNDVLSMQEIIKRRLNHMDDWGLPDIIAIDGGKGQVRAVKEVLDKEQISIPVIGMIKDNKHRTRGIIDLNENELNLTNNRENKSLLRFITFIQDEVHRFTIRYHRKIRDEIK